MTTNVPLWQPTLERIALANITQFTQRVASATGRELSDYAALWRWSNDEREAFWRAVWDYAGIVGQRGSRTLVDGHKMPGARWFPDARLCSQRGAATTLRTPSCSAARIAIAAMSRMRS